MKEIGVYIHIPFCIKKCDYCDFVSYSDKNHFVEDYIEKLKQEITITLKQDEYEIKTIYIGGGTPSSIASSYIIDIVNTIKSSSRKFSPCEITIEVNPRNNNKGKIIRL